MMVDEKETGNGHCSDLNCSIRIKTEGTDNDEGAVLLDGGSGGVSVGEETSAERSRIMYKRKKRRKLSSPDEKTMIEFSDKIKVGDGSAYDHDIPILSFDASPNGPDKCSIRHCRKTVLQKMHQSHKEHENDVGECTRQMSFDASPNGPESGCTPAVKESLHNVERSDNQTHGSAKELPLAISGRLLNQPEGPTISKLYELAFSDILMSEKFSELRGLLLKNFGVVDVNQILDLDAIKMKIKNGAYESSPMLYHNDIRQVWTKLQQVGNEIVTLANTLSDKSRAHYEQFARKPKSNCHGCGGAADPQNCLVCDSCEEIYHVSCTDLVGPEMPPKTWYCGRCVSNGIGSPHDNCIVCQKLKSTMASASASASASRVRTFNTNTNGEVGQGFKTCFICKCEVKPGDNFRTCGHSLCAHKLYHYNCLTRKQLGVCGPCWYCPSCLCRSCMIDKDDHQIVLCDGCDQAYHIYCMNPQLSCVPEGKWYCGKCDRDLKRIQTMKILYENMRIKVKVEEPDSGGLEMLVTAAKTLSHQEDTPLPFLAHTNGIQIQNGHPF
ncbi:unnamed protein product [Lactuca virosa]|uniref:PHD-type domain-containing protein n=1 Tax=Lactuca virosa TaxID=75947 RepID=A0AAU9M534_9ASTR|nr:unnamed protein product [Lactuca virosa]